MPSRRHQLLVHAIPRVRRSGELISVEHERARLERRHERRARSLPTRGIPGFSRRWGAVTEVLGDRAFPSYVLTPRGRAPRRTLFYVHGGGFVAPMSRQHVRYATRLAHAIGARLVMPTYPLAPEHTWRDSHDALVAHASRWAGQPGGMVLAGDSAGGGIALALAQSMRDRGATPATHVLLHAPWGDLTTSTPETAAHDALDPWLFLGKLRAYAQWWAGGPEDLARPEVSPALADLSGLPPGLMLHGTRDLLAPGCRLLTRRAAAAGWDLTTVEEPDLLHVYGILPLIPEARRAFDQAKEFLS